MTFSATFTEIRPTRQSSARTEKPRLFVLHGAAMTSLDGLSDMIVTGSRQVSAHGGFKNKRGIGWVAEEYRAWSLSDAYWDSVAYTLENANESIAGYTFSSDTQESVAKWVADISSRSGIYPHRNGNPSTWTVIGHREVYTIHGGSYATACPQALDLDWITSRAQQILLGDIKESDMLGMKIFQIVNPLGGMAGAWFAISPGHIANISAAGGEYLASILNVDSIADAATGSGVKILINETNAGILASSLGAPSGTLQGLYISPTDKIWRPGAANGAFTATDRATLDDIASKGELSQALTSTVSLVNAQAEINTHAILDKIDTIPGTSGAPLSISLTGTASPE